MNYSKYNLMGKYPGDTYPNLVQYSVESSSLVDGNGNVLTRSIDVSASYATTALWATNVVNGGGTSLTSGSTYNITSSWAISASWASSSISASYAPGGSTATYTSSLFGTASWAKNAVSASYVPNLYSQVTQSTVDSASWVSASAFITIAQTASYITSSNIVGKITAFSASWASSSISASYAPSTPVTYTSSLFGTASWANNSLTASFSNTSSYLSLWDAGLSSWVIITSYNGILTVS